MVPQEAGILRARCRAVMVRRVATVHVAALITMSTVLHVMAHKAVTMAKEATALHAVAHKAAATMARAVMVRQEAAARRAVTAARAVTETATIAVA